MPSRHELNMRARNVGIDPATYPNDSKLEGLVIFAEKNASAVTGTVGAGTLTTTGTFSDGETVTIGTPAQGGKVYTMKTALTGAKATATITSDATAPSDGDTVSIEGITYTFKTALSTIPERFQVLIGASAAIALDNLKMAINASGGTEGTEWSLGTYAHPLVTATTNADTTQIIEAREFGTRPNNYSTTETSSHLSWGAGVMSGGVANVVNEVLIGADAAASLDNLKLAINNSATEGTQYSFGTKAHPLVTATTNANDSQVVEARIFQLGDVSTTVTAANASWGAAALASEAAKVVAEPAANTAGVKATNAGVSGGANSLV